MNPFIERHWLVGFLFLNGDADAGGDGANIDVVHVLERAVAKKPRNTARVTGSTFGNSRHGRRK